MVTPGHLRGANRARAVVAGADVRDVGLAFDEDLCACRGKVTQGARRLAKDVKAPLPFSAWYELRGRTAEVAEHLAERDEMNL